jgi:hypothetical protein
MSESDAFPVIFFMLSFYGFCVAVLYALAKAWEQALSTRPDQQLSAHSVEAKGDLLRSEGS